MRRVPIVPAAAATDPSEPSPPRQWSGTALLSLAFGLAGFAIPFIAGLVAIVTGAVAVRQVRTGNLRGRGLAVAGIVTGALSIVFAIVVLVAIWPRVQLARELSRRSDCAKQMNEIGAALLAYAHNNHGAFPPSLETIVEDNSLPAELLVCPGDRRASAASGSSGADQAETLRASTMTAKRRRAATVTTSPTAATTPGTSATTAPASPPDVPGPHLSYTYLGGGRVSDTPDAHDLVLLLEPTTNHAGGMNVLYADGHVQFVTPADAERVTAAATSGHNPPPATTE
jgi:prepilin-type processing-associated H-X9-DG protein